MNTGIIVWFIAFIIMCVVTAILFTSPTKKATPLMEWKQQFDLLRCPDQTGVSVSGIEIDMAALKLRCSYQPIKGK